MSIASSVKVRSISASVGNKVIANAKYFFTGEKHVVFDEIFQNSRRAQASSVTITMRPTLNDFDLIIEDDGIGLEAENAGVLLQVSGSNNSDEVEINEQAAGIGFFALANFDLEIASRDWTMTIPKEAFSGEKTATITQGKTRTGGFKITILAAASLFNKAKGAEIGADEIFDLIKKRLRFSGLRWRFQTPLPFKGNAEDFSGPKLKTIIEDGVTWYESEVFLNSVADRVAPNDILSDIRETRHGVTVRILRHASSYLGSCKQINFFGKIIEDKHFKHFEKITVPIARVDLEATSPYSGISSVHIRASVLIDVHDTSTLKLRLPDREAVIEDKGFALIEDFITELMLRNLAGESLGASPLAGKNGISLQSPLRALQKKRRSDLVIPPPSIALTHICGEEWTSFSSSEYAVLPDDHSLVDTKGKVIAKDDVLLIRSTDILLSFADAKAPLPTFVGTGSAQAMFGEQTPYRSCETALIHFVHGDESDSFGFDVVEDMRNQLQLESEPAYATFTNKIVDEIAVELQVLSPDGRAVESVFIPLDAYAEGEAYEFSVVLKRGVSENNAVTSIVDALHSFGSDGESSYDSQLENSTADITTIVRNLLGVSDTIIVDEIQSALWSLMYRYKETYFNTDRDFTITMGPKGVVVSLVEDGA